MQRQVKEYLIVPGVLTALFSIYSMKITPGKRSIGAKTDNLGNTLLSLVLTGPIDATLLKFYSLK